MWMLVKFWPISSSFLKAQKRPQCTLCSDLLFTFLCPSPMNIHPYWFLFHVILGFLPPPPTLENRSINNNANDDIYWLLTYFVPSTRLSILLTLLRLTLKLLSYYPYFISEETGPETSKLPGLLNFSVVDLGLTVGILTPESTCSLSLPPHNWNRVLN